MEKNIQPRVISVLERAKQEVGGFLPEPNKEEGARALRKYTAAIEGNFIAWMGVATLCAKSVQGRYAASENLWVEVKDDHAGMLRNFARCAQCEPSLPDYQAVSVEVESIRKMVSRLSGLECLALMAVLENTSGVFVPWLEKVAAELGSTDLKYTKIHGEADIDHADQFAWALSHEIELHENADFTLDNAVKTTLQFLKRIFV
jgi:hypothetical protein